MQDETRRSIYISWGASVMGIGAGFLLGGPYVGAVAVAVGIYLALRGHFPALIESRRGTYISAFCLFILLVGLGLHFYIFHNRLVLPPPTAQYMTSYGTTTQDGAEFRYGVLVRGQTSSDVAADTQLLTKYATHYKLMAVCFHWYGQHGYIDTTGLSKSKIYDIKQSSVLITLPWGEQFIREIPRGNGTTYALLLVPNEFSPDRFETIREATQRGAFLLQASSGPP